MSTEAGAPSVRSDRGKSPSRTDWGTALITALLLTGVANDIQGVALSPLVTTVTEELGLSTSQMSWALISTTLAGGVSVGILARLGDRLGRKKVLIAMLLIGLAGSLIGALATNFAMLLISRATLGLAITAPLAWGLLKSHADGRRLESAAHQLGLTIAIFTPIALVMGGAFVTAGLSWTTVFWVIFVVKLLTLVLVLRAPETPLADRSPVPIEWIGSIGFSVWLFCLLLAITQGGTWGWGSVAVIGLFIAAVTAFTLWVLQQRATAAPLLDMRDMNKRQVIAGFSLLATVAGVSTGGMYIMVPRFVATPPRAGYGFGTNVLESALTLAPILIGVLLGGLITRRLMARFGPRVPVLLGGLFAVCGFVLIAVVHDQLWHFYLLSAVWGLGATLTYNVGWALVATAGRKDNMAITFGVQAAISFPGSAMVTALLLALLAPDPVSRMTAHGAYTAAFLVVSAMCLLGLFAVGMWLVPRALTYQGDIASQVTEEPRRAAPAIPTTGSP